MSTSNPPASSSQPLRQDLISSAVSFLRDPSVQSAPIAKRIAFLESKGLNEREIEEALRQAGQGSGGAPSLPPQQMQPYYAGPGGQQMYAPAPPPVPQRDWRDYFIMAIVSGGLVYGVASLARKYLLPHLQPPSSTQYESDLEALNKRYDEAADLLQTLQSDTTAIRDSLAGQQEKVEETIREVEGAVKAVRDGELQTRSEMESLKREVDTIRESLPRMIQSQETAQSTSLSELQAELKSLKSLLLSRPASPAAPTSGGLPSGLNLGVPGGKPSIPAWQLKGASAPATPGASTAAGQGEENKEEGAAAAAGEEKKQGE